MFDETQTRRDNALDFLDDLDRRHDFLLAELDQLNSRVDAVLGVYTKSRQSAAEVNGEGALRLTDTLAPGDTSVS